MTPSQEIALLSEHDAKVLLVELCGFLNTRPRRLYHVVRLYQRHSEVLTAVCRVMHSDPDHVVAAVRSFVDGLVEIRDAGRKNLEMIQRLTKAVADMKLAGAAGQEGDHQEGG